MNAYMATIFLVDGTSVQAGQIKFSAVGTHPANSAQVVVCMDPVDPDGNRKFGKFLVVPMANIIGVSSDTMGDTELN